MRKPLHIFYLLIAAIIGGVLLFSPSLRAADPVALLCPNGQTVQLDGEAPPGEALLIYMRSRAVGGGLAGPDGRYSLPLRAQERPGIYPVEVRQRSSRALVASYTCFVDVPLDTTLTPTASSGPTSAAPAPPVAPTAAPTTVATRTTGPTATIGAVTAQPTARAATPTTRATGGTVTTPSATTTVIASATPTATVSVTVTATVNPNVNVEIYDVALSDPAFPDVTEEYVQIRNIGRAAVNLQGWSLRNASRAGQAQPFIFPPFELEINASIGVFSGEGDNNFEDGDFYWGLSSSVWQIGDRAELRNPQGQVISILSVPEQ